MHDNNQLRSTHDRRMVRVVRCDASVSRLVIRDAVAWESFATKFHHPLEIRLAVLHAGSVFAGRTAWGERRRCTREENEVHKNHTTDVRPTT